MADRDEGAAGEEGKGSGTGSWRGVTIVIPTRFAETARPAPAGPPGGAAAPPEPRYRDGTELGRGGMGAVRRSYDTALCREVAKKVLHPHLRSERALLRFVEEAQIAGQLEHPNIAPVYDLGGGEAGEEPYFTMKLVGGRTLTRLITELHASLFGERELEHILRVLLAVCDAVSFAHSRGVIHRDLKPDNVMVGGHGQVYVMDWGIALLRGDARPSEGAGTGRETGAVPGPVVSARQDPPRPDEVLGSPSYMAPEQARGQVAAIDERTDVFGIGAILYHVLTGWPPYAGGDVAQVLAAAAGGEITPPEEVCPGSLPAGLCDIARKALATDPQRRYRSVEALAGDLARFLHGGGWFATRRYSAGQHIVREGDPGDEGYAIVSGRCEVYQTRGDRKVVVRQLGPGDVFGETAILMGEPRTAAVVALEDVTVKVITAETLERELRLNTWVGALIRQLGARFLEMETQLRRREA